MKYRDQLRTSEWRNRRQEILDRDKSVCQRENCDHRNDSRVNLVVHHKRYLPGRMAWEYADDDLTTLCWTCHDKVHQKQASSVSAEGLSNQTYYTSHEIRDLLQFTPSGYLTRKGDEIICGRFWRDLNPDAPEIILPGTDPKWIDSARLLAEQSTPIPVFVKEAGFPWLYTGMYQSEGSTQNPIELEIHQTRAQKHGREIPVGMVLFLRAAE